MLLRRLCMLAASALLSMMTHASLKNNDVTDQLADRYQTSCQIRDHFDLYQFGRVLPELAEFTQKIKTTSDDFRTNSIHFNKVYFYHIPVSKIEYVILPNAKRQQSVYLDLTSMTARQQFSQIKFHHEQGLSMVKEGRFVVLTCTW